MDTDNLHLMGRRNFLTALTSIGISSSAVAHMTKAELENLTDDPTEQVPRLSRLERTEKPPFDTSKPPAREPVYYTIDRDEWEIREGSMQAAADLQRELDVKLDGQLEVSVTSRVINHNSRRVVRVALPTGGSSSESDANLSLDDLRGEIPTSVSATLGTDSTETEVEDIPVVVEKAQPTEQLSPKCDSLSEEDYFTDYYDPLLGGVTCSTGATPFTFSFPVYDHDRGEDRMLTVDHGFRDREDAYQPCEQLEYAVGQKDKTPGREGYEGDVATVDCSATDRELARGLAREGGGPAKALAGTIALDELNDNEDNSDYTVFRNGRRSGTEDGHITDLAPTINGDVGRIRISGSAEGGDSGSPFYTMKRQRRGSYAYAIGILEERDRYGRIQGPIMAHVEDVLNVSV